MKTLHLPCRYQRVVTDPQVPCDEANLAMRERDLFIPISQAALVLVDVWNIDFIDSYFERVRFIIENKIAPALQAARRNGMTVIHAPSPEIARRYSAPAEASTVSLATNWPPREFMPDPCTGTRSGQYAVFGRDPEPRLTQALEWFEKELDIAPETIPLSNEPVVRDGQELHKVLTEQKILHLFYAGFAANWCILNRDYGVIEMHRRGYNIILLRDATTGIEAGDTATNLALTNASIREIETKYAWSASTADFLKAHQEHNE